ncbi:metallophosphoesterase [Tenuibacillus multivorans]|uniref:Protein phosphatase n=1 Tax=Tenuibacillus multivorans TaxID=237069 RepID=A0A1H0B3K9_9BACI|nr:metallophosphoesterase [Tenuibacillus multivorans]GEL77544.1 serine/threonine protein phosphatase [Tenuibacillus multivorans]SDN40217.1 protein phosphatase [Tenuibacillus multivorans]
MIDVRKLNLDKNRRIIVISDIHASLDLFKQLLSDVHYTNEDYLFINGDLCEKGHNSLEVVHYVKQMSLNSERVYLTKGNCDVIHRYVFEGHEGIYNYMESRKESVLNEMLEYHGKSLHDFQNLEELGTYYLNHFKNEIEWLDSLPTAYETDEYIIIHAGLNETLEQTDEPTALYVPAFYEKGHKEDKIVIVGHWPVANYRANQISSNNPIIDYEQRVIALDGGNRIKRDGQLNALIIENGNYSYTYVDSLRDGAYIQKDHLPSEDRKGNVTYPNYDMNIIKEEKFFTLCQNEKLGIQQWIKNEYLIESDGKTMCKSDLSTTFLSVEAGDQVWIIDDNCAGYFLIKNVDGDVGWVPDGCFK